MVIIRKRVVVFSSLFFHLLALSEGLTKLKMPKLTRRLLLLKEDCGEVCNTSDNFPKQLGKYFDNIQKNIDCDLLFESPMMDLPVIKEEQMNTTKPPKVHEIPTEILNMYTFDQRVIIGSVYFDLDAHWTESEDFSSTWTKEMIEYHIMLHKAGKHYGGYGSEGVKNMSRVFNEHMKDQVIFSLF